MTEGFEMKLTIWDHQMLPLAQPFAMDSRVLGNERVRSLPPAENHYRCGDLSIDEAQPSHFVFKNSNWPRSAVPLIASGIKVAL